MQTQGTADSKESIKCQKIAVISSRHDFGAFDRSLNFLLRLLRMRKSPSVKVKADSGMNLHVLITIEYASSKQHRSKAERFLFAGFG